MLETIYFLRRSLGTLLLAAVLGMGVAYFLLRYVPQRTANLTDRYFQVLAESGRLLQADSVKTTPGFSGARQLDKPDIRRRDVFEHLFLVKLADSVSSASGVTPKQPASSATAFYAADSGAFHLVVPAHTLATWFEQQAPVYGGRSTTLTLAEQPYRLFALPVQRGQRGNWLLCGTVLAAQFDREARALPAGWSVFIMGLVLLVLLALPFLKLALMSEREQLSRTDLAQCVLALVLGTSILLLTCQATLVRHYFEQVRIDSQLRGLSERVATSLRDSLGTTGRACMPLLPPGFSYGVADGSGAVRLHATPALHTGENLRQSCVPSQPVAALLNGFIDTLTTSVTYRGHAVRLHLARLDSLPTKWRKLPAGQSYYLATYFDLRYSSTHQFHVWVMTVKLLGIFWLVVLGFGLLYQLRVRRSDSWPLSRDTLRHFWPGRGYAFRYYQVLGGILMGVFVLGIAYCFVQPLAQFYLLLTVLVQLFLLSFRFTRLRHMQELTPLKTSLWVAGIYLLLLTFGYLLLFHWAAQNEYWNWGGWALVALDIIQLLLGLASLQRASTPPAQEPPTTANETQNAAKQVFWTDSRITYLWAALAALVIAFLVHLLANHHHDFEAAWLLALRGSFSMVLWLLWRQLLNRPDYNGKLYMLLHKSRRAYKLLVLGWIVLLGIVPVVLFYRVSRTTERLGEVRRAQVTMLHELAEQPNAIPDMMQAFYKTRLLTGAARDSLRPRGAGEGGAALPAPAADTWRLNMAVLSRLHPNAEYLDADTLATSSLLLEPTTAWHLHSLAGWESYKPVSSVAAARGSVSTIDFWSSFIHGLWQIVVVVLLGLALWFVVEYTMQKFFPEVVGPPTRLTWAQKKELQVKQEEERAQGAAGSLPLAANLLPHRFWLLPGRSDWHNAPPWVVKQLGVEAAAVPATCFDCRLLFPLAPPPDGLKPPAPLLLLPGASAFTSRQEQEWDRLRARLAGAGRVVPNWHIPLVLTHFEHGSSEPSITDAKCRLLEMLLPLNWPLLVLSSMHPAAFGDCGHAVGADCTLPGHAAVRTSGQRLLDLLANFRLQYFSPGWVDVERPLPDSLTIMASLSPFERVRQQAELAADLLMGVRPAERRLRVFFEREYQAFPFPADLRTDALAALWRQRSPIAEVRYAKYEEELKAQQTARQKRANDIKANQTSPAKGPANIDPALAITELTPTGARVDQAIAAVNHDYRTEADHLQAELNAHDHFGRFEPPTREAIADTFRRLAWLYFRQLWNNLAPQEQFLLYDLAYDGLVNPQNRHHLHNLLHKGLLRLDGHGRLRLASEAFRAFVFAKSRRPQALRYAPDDRWGAVRVPLVLLLVSGALFVALTQSVPLSQLQWVLALLVALLPQLSTLLKIPAPTAPPPDKQE